MVASSSFSHLCVVVVGLLRLIEYADLGVNDYAAPVLDPDAAASLAADRQVSKKIRRMLGRFDLLRIERVADSPDLMLSLIAGATAKRHAYNTHIVDLPENAEAWRAQLDPKFSRHLERAYKRLRPKGERRLRIIDDVAEVESVMERMQTFREARFAEHRGTDLVQDPDCFSFYSAVARSSVEMLRKREFREGRFADRCAAGTWSRTWTASPSTAPSPRTASRTKVHVDCSGYEVGGDVRSYLVRPGRA